MCCFAFSNAAGADAELISSWVHPQNTVNFTFLLQARHDCTVSKTMLFAGNGFLRMNPFPLSICLHFLPVIKVKKPPRRTAIYGNRTKVRRRRTGNSGLLPKQSIPSSQCRVNQISNDILGFSRSRSRRVFYTILWWLLHPFTAPAATPLMMYFWHIR